jgi:hypothetical protein
MESESRRAGEPEKEKAREKVRSFAGEETGALERGQPWISNKVSMIF